MSSIFITGANGFLGKAVVRQLTAQNVTLKTTDISAASPSMLPNYIALDLTTASSFSELLKDVNCVIHIAGWVHRFHHERDEYENYYKINVGVTEKLLRDSIDSGVQHFVFVSSVSVYGAESGVYRGETDNCHPEGPYAKSKYEAEIRIREIAEKAGIRATIVRPVTLFGEGDPGNVARLISTIDRGRFVWIGSGTNRKSLIHRDDAAQGLILAGQRTVGELVEIYNLAALTPTMREIVDGIAFGLNKKPPSLCIPATAAIKLSAMLASVTRGIGPLGSIKNTVKKWLADDVYDGSKLREAVGFEPQITLSEGLQRETEWYRSLKKSLSRNIRL